MADGARRPNESAEHGYTCLKPAGLTSFKVLAEFPGPVAEARQEAQETAQAAQGFAFQGDPMIFAAQAMFAQAQALMLMGQAMLAQAQQARS